MASVLELLCERVEGEAASLLTKVGGAEVRVGKGEVTTAEEGAETDAGGGSESALAEVGRADEGFRVSS